MLLGLKELQLVQAFVQLDIGAPGIRDERERDTQIQLLSAAAGAIRAGGQELVQAIEKETEARDARRVVSFPYLKPSLCINSINNNIQKWNTRIYAIGYSNRPGTL